MQTEATVVVQDERLPLDQFLFEGIDTTHGASCRFSVSGCDPEKCHPPTFTISEVAKVFFGQSAHWIRWRENNDFFELDGQKVGNRRTPTGARVYFLEDIELIAHALASKGALEQQELTNALVILQAVGRIWGYLA